MNLVNSGFQFTTPSRSTYIPIDAVFNGLASAPYTSAPPIANTQVWKPVDINAVRSVVRDAYVSAAQRPSPAPEPGIIRSGFDYVSNTAAAGYVRGLKNSVDRTAELAFRGAVYAWNDPRGAIASVGSGLQETKDTITDYTVGWFFESQRAKNSATIRGASDAAIARFDQLKDASTYEQARAIGDIVGTGAQLWSPTTRLTSRIRPLAIIDDVAPSNLPRSLEGLQARIDTYANRAQLAAFDKGLSGLEAGKYADRYFSKAVSQLDRNLVESGSDYRVLAQYGRNVLGAPLAPQNRPAGSLFLDAALTNRAETTVFSGWDTRFQATPYPSWNTAAQNAGYVNRFQIQEGFVREISVEARRP